MGRSLCEAVVRWCREQGAVEMELEVRAGSSGAIALYTGLGFIVVGRRAGYYRDPNEDAVLMQLKLAESSNPHCRVCLRCDSVSHYVKRCLLLEVFPRANWQVYRATPPCVSTFHPTISTRTQPV